MSSTQKNNQDTIGNTTRWNTGEILEIDFFFMNENLFGDLWEVSIDFETSH